MSAIILSLITKLLPYVFGLLTLSGVSFSFFHHRNKVRKDKMEEAKAENLNQASQLNAVKQVEEDMAQATSNHASLTEVSARLKDGSF